MRPCASGYCDIQLSYQYGFIQIYVTRTLRNDLSQYTCYQTNPYSDIIELVPSSK